MIQICIYLHCNKETGNYDVIKPGNSAIRSSAPSRGRKFRSKSRTKRKVRRDGEVTRIGTPTRTM